MPWFCRRFSHPHAIQPVLVPVDCWFKHHAIKSRNPQAEIHPATSTRVMGSCYQVPHEIVGKHWDVGNDLKTLRVYSMDSFFQQLLPAILATSNTAFFGGGAWEKHLF